MNQAIRRRHGFSIIEVLMALGLLVTFLAVSARLFNATMRLNREAPAAISLMRSQAQWLPQLQADAWSSRDAQTQQDGSVQFIGVDGAAITWRQAERSLERVAGGRTQTWSEPRNLRFERREGLLRLVEGDSIVPLAMPLVEGGAR